MAKKHWESVGEDCASTGRYLALYGKHRKGMEAGKCGAVEVHVSGHIILLRANTRCFVEARQRGACDHGLVANG